MIYIKLSMAVLFLVTSFNCVFAAETSGETESELLVKSGELTFGESPDIISFGEITLNGRNQKVSETSESEIWINDYRGLPTHWELFVKEKKNAEDVLSFYDNGLRIVLKPVIEEVIHPVVEVTGENKKVIMGGALKNRIILGAALEIPSNINAKKYKTTIEWTLKPSE